MLLFDLLFWSTCVLLKRQILSGLVQQVTTSQTHELSHFYEIMWHAQVSREGYFWLRCMNLKDTAGNWNKNKKWEMLISVPVLLPSLARWTNVAAGSRKGQKVVRQWCKNTHTPPIISSLLQTLPIFIPAHQYFDLILRSAIWEADYFFVMQFKLALQPFLHIRGLKPA